MSRPLCSPSQWYNDIQDARTNQKLLVLTRRHNLCETKRFLVSDCQILRRDFVLLSFFLAVFFKSSQWKSPLDVYSVWAQQLFCLKEALDTETSLWRPANMNGQ